MYVITIIVSKFPSWHQVKYRLNHSSGELSEIQSQNVVQNNLFYLCSKFTSFIFKCDFNSWSKWD